MHIMVHIPFIGTKLADGTSTDMMKLTMAMAKNSLVRSTREKVTLYIVAEVTGDTLHVRCVDKAGCKDIRDSYASAYRLTHLDQPTESFLALSLMATVTARIANVPHNVFIKATEVAS